MMMEGGVVRVEALARSGISEVPREYVQPTEQRPQPRQDDMAEEIPIVNLSASECDRREAVGRACREWGCFHVTNHGVPLQLLEEMRAVSLRFFEECPLSQKLAYAYDPSSPASQGYGSRMLLNSDVVFDWRDYFDYHTFPLSRRDPSRWPPFPPSYRQVVAEYSDHMKFLAQRLLALISDTLGLAPSCIEDAVGDLYQNIAVSYYPPCPQPDLTLGLQSHSDMGALTLLIQDDVGGLQVLKDVKWVTVPPLHHAVFVILADQTEIITNGAYRSAQHRAITNASRARLSVATFHDPAKTVKIAPASELLSNSSPALYREVVYGEYVSSWYTKGPEGKRNIDALLLEKVDVNC